MVGVVVQQIGETWVGENQAVVNSALPVRRKKSGFKAGQVTVGLFHAELQIGSR